MKQEAALGIAGLLARAIYQVEADAADYCGVAGAGLLCGAVIPREEEPQILVPMLDVTTAMPGASPPELNSASRSRLRPLMHEIPAWSMSTRSRVRGRAWSSFASWLERAG